MGPSKESQLTRTVYTGNFLWTPSLGQLKVLENAVIGVDDSGTIAFILECGEDEPVETAPGSGDLELRFMFLEKVRQHGWKDGEWNCVVGGKGGRGWWFPGFIGALSACFPYPLDFLLYLCLVTYWYYSRFMITLISRVVFNLSV